MPLAVNNLAIFYNKSQFESTIPERGKPALTWSEIQTDCIKLNKLYRNSSRFERSCIALGIMSNISKSVDILTALILQLGGQIYTPNLNASLVTACNGNICPAKDAIRMFVSFANQAHKNYLYSCNSLL